jgi:WD40 repeat protein
MQWNPVCNGPPRELFPAGRLEFIGDRVLAVAAMEGRILVLTRSYHVLRLDLPIGGQVPQVFEICKGEVKGEARSNIALSPDGKILAVIDDDNALVLLDTDSLRPLGQKLSGPFHDVVGFCTDGKMLVLADSTGDVILCDPARRAKIGQIHIGHAGPVTSMVLLPNVQTLASCDMSGMVLLTSLKREDAQLLCYPPGLDGPFSSFSFTTDRKTLALASRGGTILLDSESGNWLGDPILNENGRDRLGVAALSPDGAIVAVNYHTLGCMGLLDVARRELIRILSPGHINGVTCAAFSPTMPILATGGLDGVIILWDCQSWERLGELLAADDNSAIDFRSVYAIAFRPDGRVLRVSTRLV